MTERFLRLKEVMPIVGLKHSSIYDKIKRGEFPAPYPLGARAIGFLSSEIDAWIKWRIASRDVLIKNSNKKQLSVLSSNNEELA